MLTTSEDHAAARLWDAATGAEIAALRHDRPVESAVFDRSGVRVLTASKDHTARLWDVASAAEIAVLRHDHPVVSAMFDRSGARVLTASGNTARIWRVFPTVAALVEYASAIMPRALTQEQRKQYFLD